MKAALSKYICKRRLEGGEFLYVYRPRGESVAGKRAVWNILRTDEKVLSRVREVSNLGDGEEFESVVLKTIPLLPYEEFLSSCENDIKVENQDDYADEDNEEEMFEKVSIAREDLGRSVIVRTFPVKATAQECETFLRSHCDDPGVIMRRETVGRDKTEAPVFKGSYSLIFSEVSKAKQFLQKKDPLSFNGKVLSSFSCVTSLQRRTLFSLGWRLFSPALASVVGLVEEKRRDRVVFGAGVDKLEDKRLQELFCGMEAEYENIVSVKNVFVRSGHSLKYQFIQFELNDLKSAEQFSAMQSKKVDGKILETITLREYQRQVSVFGNANNLEFSGQTENSLLFINFRSGLEVETIFPTKKSVQIVNLGFSMASIVEFASEAEATEATLQCPTEVPLGTVISMTDYFAIHEGEMRSIENEIMSTEY